MRTRQRSARSRSSRYGKTRSPLSTKRLLALEPLEKRQVMAAYISEVHFAPLFGNAAEDQYIELRGEANSTLSAGTYLVAIHSVDGVVELGDVHSIFDLSNQSFGSNGMLVLMQSAAGYAVDAGARLLKGTDGFSGIPGNIFSADGNAKQIRTGSNTFLLVQSNVAPALTNDIDSNDDGAPDGAYSNWTVLDGFAVFPWVENLWPQRGYAPITFQERGVGKGMFGSTLVTTDQLAYVARIGRSTGFQATDWVAGNTVEIDSGSPTPSWQFQLQHGVFGTPRPYAFGGRVLDHIGANNFVNSVSGAIFLDGNADGIQQPGEAPLSGITVAADLQGDGLLGVYSDRIEPNNYPVNSDVSNASSNVTLVSAGSDNVHQGFKIRPVQRFGAPVGELIFSHENVGFFNNNRRLRMDFYRPARSISIDVIGNSDLSPTYGRLEIFNSAGTSLGFVRTQPLGANQTQRLTMSSTNNDIAWALAYSDDSFLGSSPFGMLDNLSVTLPEQTAVTDAQGTYRIESIARGTYQVYAQRPAGFDQVFPVGNSSHTVSMTQYGDHVSRNFGLLGNLPPTLNDQSFAVSEASISGAVLATLPIARGYPSQTLNVTITSGDPTGLFTINATNGQITLNRAELDFESTVSYTLNVRLEDAANPSLNDTAVIRLVVDDANEAPQIAAKSVSIAENTPALTTVATMSATDPDAGVAGQFTWSIVGGNVGDAFAVDPQSGVVRINDATKLDFEQSSIFNLVLRATDAGTPAQSADAALTVTLTNVNEPPALISRSLGVQENSSAGAAVGEIKAVDPDANQSLTWQIVGGSGAALFEIGPGDGIIKVATGAVLDFEATAQYELQVRVADNGFPQLLDTRTYIVALVDDNDPPTLAAAQFSIAEESAAGSTVGVILAQDQDAGQSLRYSIAGADAALFTIDAQSGELQIAVGAELDFESKPTLNFTVTASDSTSNPRSTSAAVVVQLTNVNEPPRIDTVTINVAENSPVGSKAAGLSFVDPDSGETVRFEILEQSLNWFNIDSATGDLLVAQGATIDFEGANQNVLRVRVTDAAGLSNVGTVTISATDRNDAPTLAVGLANAEAIAGSPFSHTLPANTFVDQDAGDSLRLFATRGSGFSLPSWLSFDAQNRTFSGTPSVDDAGPLAITVTAIDAAGAAKSTSFSINVISNPFPWSNPAKPLDASNDGAVTGIDALLVINFLNTVGSKPVDRNAPPTNGMLDANQDNSVSPIDALLIINDINQRAAGGEGERAVETNDVDEIVWTWDFSHSTTGESNAADIERKRRDAMVELLALARRHG